jgi:hypothetical protein
VKRTILPAMDESPFTIGAALVVDGGHTIK